MYEGFKADIASMVRSEYGEASELEVLADGSLERLAGLFDDRNDKVTRGILVQAFVEGGMSLEDSEELVDGGVWAYRFSPYSND